jgi:1-acyl-sn-glycerol-3-phosphate acyltransferase
MKKFYDLLLKFFFIVGYYTKSLKNGKEYEFIYSEETKQNVIKAFKNKRLLIVSNHMTLLDSVLIQLFIIKIFGWHKIILNNFRQLCWNLPAIENLDMLKKNSSKTNNFLYKNINRFLPIDRSNQDSSLKTLEKVSKMTGKGSVFLIYPEAGRTRRHEFSQEDITPGAAKVMLDCKKITGSFPGLLIIYVRSQDQIGHSDLPYNNKIKIFADYSNDFPINENESLIRKRKNLMIFMGKKINSLQEKFHLKC